MPFASLASEIKLPFASLEFEIKFRHAAGARMIYTDEGVENLHGVCVK